MGPRDGRPTEGGQTGLPRMTTDNSTTPSPHFFRQAGGPQKKDQPSPELSARFHVFASGQEFEEEGGGWGGACVPFRSSGTAHVSSFARS